MSFQERKAILSLISNIVIFTAYYIIVLQWYNEKGLSTEAFFRFWGSAMLLLIPVLVIPKLFINIVFIIINRVVTKEIEPKFNDELDQLINIRAALHFLWVFMTGFMLSMGTLAIGLPPFVLFNILLFSAIVGGIVMDITHVYYYRKGIK